MGNAIKEVQMCLSVTKYLPTSIGDHMTKQKKEPINKAQQKYVDDMTQSSVLNLKKYGSI